MIDPRSSSIQPGGQSLADRAGVMEIDEALYPLLFVIFQAEDATVFAGGLTAAAVRQGEGRKKLCVNERYLER